MYMHAFNPNTRLFSHWLVVSDEYGQGAAGTGANCIRSFVARTLASKSRDRIVLCVCVWLHFNETTIHSRFKFHHTTWWCVTPECEQITYIIRAIQRATSQSILFRHHQLHFCHFGVIPSSQRIYVSIIIMYHSQFSYQNHDWSLKHI